MASWFDLFAFVLMLSAFVGAIIGVRAIARHISSTVTATKESLKDRGLTISDKGVSVRTSSRYTREDYVDATQRGLLKAMGASSFSVAGSTEKVPVLERHNSSASIHSNGSGSDKSSEKARKHRFSLRKKNGDS